MKYKVGDRVRIKDTDIEGTIESIIRGQFIVDTKGSKIPIWPEDIVLMKSVEEETTSDKVIEEAKTYWDSIKDAWICPDGYIFKDENGNVINATKIVLEKKKKEYPKTFEECLKILGYNIAHTIPMNHGHNGLLMMKLQRLLIFRDAYWKIAGEEMGLGKPWEPDWEDCTNPKYTIHLHCDGHIFWQDVSHTEYRWLSFPTAEMRDAFYEYFKEEIEKCKELL